MKRFFGLAVLVFVGVAGWRIGDSLSSDALSMAVGVLFGVMAGIPTALLVMAGARRPRGDEPGDGRSRAPGGALGALSAPYLPQPPVIVVAPPAAIPQAVGAGAPALAGPVYAGAPWEQARPARRFKVVGEREEWLEDW
jgi:hypothetical protein